MYFLFLNLGTNFEILQKQSCVHVFVDVQIPLWQQRASKELDTLVIWVGMHLHILIFLEICPIYSILFKS